VRPIQGRLIDDRDGVNAPLAIVVNETLAGDPLTFAAVLGLLGGVAIIACAIPAVRAARVDPMLVLRDQ
jgi:hypothetical protein